MIFVYIAIGYIALCLLFLLFHLYYLWRATTLSKTYNKYIQNHINNVGDWSIVEKTTEIQNLFKVAGIKDCSVPYTKAIGFYQVANTSLSVHENIASVTPVEIPCLVNQMFRMTIGTFKYRCKNSFNPIWWASNILSLPSTVFEYMGIENKTWGRVANVIVWLAAAVPFLIKYFLVLKTALGF